MQSLTDEATPGASYQGQCRARAATPQTQPGPSEVLCVEALGSVSSDEGGSITDLPPGPRRTEPGGPSSLTGDQTCVLLAGTSLTCSTRSPPEEAYVPSTAPGVGRACQGSSRRRPDRMGGLVLLFLGALVLAELGQPCDLVSWRLVLGSFLSRSELHPFCEQGLRACL